MAERFKTTGVGKGSNVRPYDYKKYSEMWDRIFGKKRKLTKRPKRPKMVPET